MRQPKYRAWDKLDKQMLEVKGIDWGLELAEIWMDDEYSDSKPFDEVKLMEFTGLKDKNGIEIYEGDIVKIPDDYDTFGHNAGEILKVAFNNGCFRLKRPNSKGRGFYFEDDNTVEIIGDIYNNPELLGEEE